MSCKDWVRSLTAAAALLLVPALGFAQGQPGDTTTAQPAPNAAPSAPSAATETVTTAPAGDETVGPAPKRRAEESISVTGSRVRRKDLTTPAPVTVLSRQQIQNSAVASVGDFLQMMPEQGNATNTAVNNGGDGSTTISLRSLGAFRTLVLVDGKRYVYSGGFGGGVNNTVDLNSIPSAAIERVEVLKDGASAVYGSDAIGGVVNIITRHKMNGTEASAYAGTSQHGDGTVYDFNVTTGASGDRGGFVFGAGYYDQRSFLAANRDWAKYALSNYDYTTPSIDGPPGGSSRVPQGRVQGLDPSKCSTSACVAMAAAFGAKKRNFIYDPSAPACPSTGPATPGCQAAGFRPFNNATDLYNYQAVNFLITPSKRISLFSNGEYRINESARAYVQGTFVNRQSSNLLAPEPLDLAGLGTTLSPQNQFNPFNTAVSVRKRLVTADGRSQMQDIDTFRVVTGIDGTLPDAFGPAKGFFYDLSFNYGRTTGDVLTHGSVNALKVAQAVGPSFQDSTGVWRCGTATTGAVPGCVPANLFGLGTPVGAQLSSLGAEDLVNRGFNQQVVAQATLSGELFKLASERPVGLAVGYEFHREYGGYQPDSTATQSFTNANNFVVFVDSDYGSAATRGAYNVNEGYGELDVPLISGMPGIDDLEVQGAIRAFRYSTFGSDYTYKLGLRYRPIRDVTFRATYSTAFRAPSIPELFGGRAPAAEPASDPCSSTTDPVLIGQCGAAQNNGDGNVQINSNVGGSASLQPETAQAFTGGVVLEPQMVRGLSVTADYFHTRVKNTIVGGNLTANYLNACYPGTGGTPDAEACSHIHRDPITQVINVVDDYQRNLGDLIVHGVDLATRYTMATDYGRFGFLVDASVLLRYDQNIFTPIKGVGNYDLGVNPRLKFNAGINYGFEGLSVGVLGHYIGTYHECAASDGSNAGGGCYQKNVNPDTNQLYPYHKVPQEMTFDVFASYLVRSPLGNTTLAAGMRNVLDTNPVRVYNSFLTYADPSAYDFVGRYFYGRVSHAF